MADVKDSALQIVASVLGAQEWGVNDAGVTRRITNDLVKAYVAAPSTGFPGVVTREQFTSNTGTVSFPNNASANSPFAAANDTFTLQAATTYFFEGLYHLTGMGATTRTTATLFGGTATLTSIAYRALIHTGAANALGTTQSTKTCVNATANVLNATVTTAAEAIEVRGIVRVNAGGTFIPQIQHSADPTGTILAQTNCYFRIYPVATNATVFVGDVS